MHAGDLLDRLRRRYPAPQYALFAEVGDETSGRSRSADAIAMGLWRSRGIELQGFEIKVDRRDWVRELKNPEKAEPIARFCDRWWIVVSDPEIVKEGELPVSWGLIAPRANDLVAVVEAPKLDAVPMTRAFLAALMRAAHKVSPNEKAVADARRAGIEIGRERERTRFGGDAEMRRELESLRRSVAAFETTSGVKIDDWNGKHIGEAVAAILDLGVAHRERELQWAADNLEHAAKTTRELLKVIAVPKKEAAE